MHFVISPSQDVPIYRQIMRQVTEAIAGGHLRSGDQLASHRELSEQLVVAPLTVKKAYDELESLGYIETRRGRGTFVSAKFPKVARAAKLEQLTEAARTLLAQAYLSGLALEDAHAALDAADKEIAAGPDTHKRRKG